MGNEQAQRFLNELAGHAVKPTIVALRERADELKKAELDRAIRRLATGGHDQAEVIQQLADNLVNKFMHGAMTELKRQAAAGDPGQTIDILRRIYGLEEESDT